jgi:hypothetical protein
MSETSKHGKRDDILYALPAGFKTLDDLVKVLVQGDVAVRKAELREWYIRGGGFSNLPPDQQDIMFAKSPEYQEFLRYCAEIDRAVPENSKALAKSLHLYFERLTERERATLEKKMKEIGDKAQEDERTRRENMEYLAGAKAREAEVIEKGRRYDAELERLDKIKTGLDQRSRQLTEREGKVQVRESAAAQYDERERQLRAREEELARQELELSVQAKRLAGALSDVAAFKKFAETTGRTLYAGIEGFAQYLKDVATRRTAKEDLVMPPGGLGQETVLDLPKQDPPKKK